MLIKIVQTNMRPHPRINIAHIITKLELGGAQKTTLNLLRLIDQDKFRVHLISSCDGELINIAKGIQGLTLYSVKNLKREISPINDFIALLKIAVYLRKYKISLVHTHSSKAGIIGRWAAFFSGVPVRLHTIHGYEFHDYQNALIRELYILAERLTAKISRALIAVCAADIEKGVSNKIAAPDKFRLIHCGIELDKFIKIKDKRAHKSMLGVDPGFKVVGTVSCFKPQKSVLDFVKMARILKNKTDKIKFIIVGDGVQRAGIEKWISRLGLQDDILLMGWQADISPILAAFDIFALTSLWEGMPLVFMEALSSGRPVVATNVGGARELIVDGVNGYLVDAKDYKGLAEKLNDILSDERRLESMSVNARDSLKVWFDINCYVKSIEALYCEIFNTAFGNSRSFRAGSHVFEHILK